ncbi:hypothetical protein [Planobispora rosea]|uniref:hypothetical protein n=1 Tax=Planobispora rosea TaxID=35762 RepID=UPI00083BA31D|nr:hypothetical protein [Planobispora rosea]
MGETGLARTVPGTDGAREADAVELASTGRGSVVLSLAGFQDQWVTVASIAGKPQRGGVPVLLLGEREGAYAFYDCVRRETFRLPVGSTSLHRFELEPDRPDDFTCDALTAAP